MKKESNEPATGYTAAEMEAKTLADIRQWVRLHQERITSETEHFRKLLYGVGLGLATLILGLGWWTYRYSRGQTAALFEEVSRITGLKEQELKRMQTILVTYQSEVARVGTISAALQRTNDNILAELQRVRNINLQNMESLNNQVRKAEASADSIASTASELKKLNETRRQILDHLNRAVKALTDKSPERLKQETQELDRLLVPAEKSP